MPGSRAHVVHCAGATPDMRAPSRADDHPVTPAHSRVGAAVALLAR